MWVTDKVLKLTFASKIWTASLCLKKRNGNNFNRVFLSVLTKKVKLSKQCPFHVLNDATVKTVLFFVFVSTKHRFYVTKLISCLIYSNVLTWVMSSLIQSFKSAHRKVWTFVSQGSNGSLTHVTRINPQKFILVVQ